VHADTVRRVVDLALGLDLPGKDESEEARAESFSCRLCDRRSAAFHPVEGKRTTRGVDGRALGHLNFAAKY
jgi:hypothetical protein